MRDAFVKQLLELAQEDKDIFLITADLGFGIFDEFEASFPDQYLNIGVAEQNMVGVATGLGLGGRKVFTYSIANFSTLRCLEQIRNDAAYHEVNLTVVSSGGGFTYGALGMSHHATEDIAIMRSLPGVTVVVPSTAWEAYHATRAITQEGGVGYLRIEKGGRKEPFDNKLFEIGKSITSVEGNDLTIITAGGIHEECLLASEVLKEKGIDARVISMHTIKPLDELSIIKAANETKNLISVEEHNKFGGLGSTIAEVIAANSLDCKFSSLALNDVYSSVVGSQEYLRKHYKLDATSIVKSAIKLLN